MMIVVPGLMGIGIYSPPLDGMGNTVRGVAFCKELVERYSFHTFDHNVDYDSKKKDPRQLQLPLHVEGHTLLLFAASQGDLLEVQSLFVKGVSLEEANVDKRTALHLSAAEGRYSVVEYLLKNQAQPNPRDRWGRTPLTDALFGDHSKTAGLIKKYDGTE
jgi:glutaminase